MEYRYRDDVLNDSPAAVRLEPRSAGLGDVIDHLLVDFGPGEKHIRQVKIQERDGDFTLLKFRNTEINPSLPDSLFTR